MPLDMGHLVQLARPAGWTSMAADAAAHREGPTLERRPQWETEAKNQRESAARDRLVAANTVDTAEATAEDLIRNDAGDARAFPSFVDQGIGLAASRAAVDQLRPHVKRYHVAERNHREKARTDQQHLDAVKRAVEGFRQWWRGGGLLRRKGASETIVCPNARTQTRGCTHRRIRVPRWNFGDACHRSFAKIHDLNSDRRRQCTPRYDFVVSKRIAHTTQPAQALAFTFQRADCSRLCRHVSYFKVAHTPDLRPVLAGMRHPPDSPVGIKQALPLSFHDWKQYGDLRRPDSIAWRIACLQNAS